MAEIAHAKPEPFSRWMARLQFKLEQKGKRLQWWHRLLWIEWVFEYVNHGLRNWAFVELLGHAARFTLLVSVILAANKYFFEADERRSARHAQAWAVIAAAAGESGDLGRKVAVETLASDKISLKAAPLTKAVLPGVNLAGAMLSEASLVGADLKRANLVGANLKRANLTRALLWDARLEGADLEGAYINNANLKGAHLEGADLKEAFLDGANLEGADLEGADLKGAYLDGADLEGADLKGAYLDGADLEGAIGLTPDQLKAACYFNQPPTLPDGLTPDIMRKC